MNDSVCAPCPHHAKFRVNVVMCIVVHVKGSKRNAHCVGISCMVPVRDVDRIAFFT